MSIEDSVTGGACRVSVDVDVLRHVNLVLVQNGLPAFRDLVVRNVSCDALADVSCEFDSADGFVIPGSIALGEIAAGAERRVSRPDIRLNQARILDAVTEPIKGSVRLSVKACGEELLSREYPMTILPADQFIGYSPYPELIAAYVQPNAEFVCQLQAEAAIEIGKATGSTALEGYQADKKRVLEMCAAIFRAIQNRGISYANPPASFGLPGQKLRLPGEIDRYKLGTCIDTTLLFASVMEKCGLHPVLIHADGHAYVGCHLVGGVLDEVIVNDAQALRKRAALDEFIAIETTLVCQDATFNDAERSGREHLDDDHAFRFAIDVVRSRENGVIPLFLGGDIPSSYRSGGRDVRVDGGEDVREVKDSIDLEQLERAARTQGRIEKWTQRLLDFSARNRLLNIPKRSRLIVQLLSPDMAKLEDQVAGDCSFEIRSIEDSTGEKTLEDFKAGRLPAAQCEHIVAAELERRRLCVALPSKEVKRRMNDLYHDSRTELEESGVNTLFLVLGTLQWVEPKYIGTPRTFKAPILMLPVKLERSSMSEGVRMRRLDEDASINATLVEFLRTQCELVIPGLDPLPTDDSGVDVAQILQIMRQAVRDRKGWEVRDESYIGCFSFGKFVMWKDMTDRADELRKQPLVNHLVGGGGVFDDGVEVFEPDKVSEYIDTSKLFCPLGADSSQLAAVLYSEMGKSFVLHGPPGTGKSQTITNIIAHNLAMGRRVLFVSEKKAALEVVQERLANIGLAPFCLELHSNKTEKGRFYAQVKEALSVPETTEPGEWGRVSGELIACRDALNGYVAGLHRRYPNGLTAYDCFSRVIGNGGAHPELLDVDCLSQPLSEYREMREAVADLIADFRAADEKALRDMPPLKMEAWSPIIERQMKNAVEELGGSSAKLADALSAVAADFGFDGALSVSGLGALSDFLEAVKGRGSVPECVAVNSAKAGPARQRELIEIALERDKVAESLSAFDLSKIDSADIGGIESRLAANRRAFCIARFFRNRTLLKELSSQGLTRIGSVVTVDSLGASLESMKKFQDLGRKFKALAPHGPDKRTELGAKARADGDAALAAIAAFMDKLARASEFVDVCGFGDDIAGVNGKCVEFVENSGDLRNVLKFRKTLERARGLGAVGFGPFVMENGGGALDVLAAFDDAYAVKMLEEIIANAPALAEFSGLAYEERIAKFRELNGKWASLSREMVFARLAAKLPRHRSGPGQVGTEFGMVKRECEKRSRLKAVRQFLAEARTLLPKLKPCFLMSPLSVAQYLPVDSEPFDLVVFDEASQIPVWDAIGVIARGRQLIVVGDPKQMPPTNFFQKGDTEVETDEVDESIADQESILDECLVAGVFSTYLNWHYRSRHESLIAFSNAHYYSNRLLTFPAAADTPRLGVKFMFVENGRLEGEGAGPRTNRPEAEALVDYICAKIHEPDYRRRSIGVVTFSIQQQHLVQSLLDDRRASDKLVDSMLPEDGPGAFFVKNLENVQGDESDVILFSVGFAPDERGKLSMNFGPLNRMGGERRLNVAITRAREQVVVFSSIRGKDIDAGENGRTHAVGAGHLKAFLEYAERGAGVTRGSDGAGSGDAFAGVVSEFLEGKGYHVDRNVGCSDYRIDVAVRDPDDPARHILAIECDGPAYASQLTPQDRDINRSGVLRGLGWHTCRVWSMDWAYDRKAAEGRLLKLIDDIRQGRGG